MNFITWFVTTYKKDIIENGFPVAALYFYFTGIMSVLGGSWIFFAITYFVGFVICAPIVYVLLKEQWDILYSRYEKARKE